MAHLRPLSPHLQIYKPQLTSVLSITHRFTGIMLIMGIIFLATWFICLGLGEEAYTIYLEHLTSWYGKIALLGWIFSFYYHLSNGIRHLIWDAGWALEIEHVYKTGWVVVITSIGLTVITVLLAYTHLGAS